MSIRATGRLAQAWIEPSVGSVGDSYEHALAQSVIGRFETEVIRRRCPRRGVESVELDTLQWMERRDNCRRLEPIGHVSRAEAEARYRAAREVTALAASLTPDSIG